MKLNLCSFAHAGWSIIPRAGIAATFLGIVFGVSGIKGADELDVLKQDLGTWEAEMTVWMPGQDEPVKMTGTETNTMLGSFLVSVFKADFFGQEFEGRGQFGYDAQKKEYIGTWIDSMEPNMSFMRGQWDAEKKAMTFLTKGFNSQMGRETEGKNVVVYKENERLMTMFMKSEDGDWTKSMEIKYTKKD